MKLLSTKFSPFSCHILALCPYTSLSTLYSDTLNIIFPHSRMKAKLHSNIKQQMIPRDNSKRRISQEEKRCLLQGIVSAFY